MIRAAQKAKDAGADIPPALGFSFSGISMGRFAAPIDGGRSARGFKTLQGGERQRLLETRVRPGMHVGEYILDLDMQSYLNYLVSTQPLKGVPAFDSKDVAGSRASGENDEFGDALGSSVNYTLFSASKTGGRYRCRAAETRISYESDEFHWQGRQCRTLVYQAWGP